MMEIMIALVVAAALSAVAAPSWQKAADKKRADRALAALMTISECIKQYKVEYRLGGNPSITYGNLESVGCLKISEFPSGFAFPAAGTTIPAAGESLAILSTDGTRMVCATRVGELNASVPAYFIDAPAGSCDAASPNIYRKISEDEIGKQRGS